MGNLSPGSNQSAVLKVSSPDLQLAQTDQCCSKSVEHNSLHVPVFTLAGTLLLCKDTEVKLPFAKHMGYLTLTHSSYSKPAFLTTNPVSPANTSASFQVESSLVLHEQQFHCSGLWHLLEVETAKQIL